MSDAYSEPMEAIPIRGAVIVDHPRSPVAIVITPKAALASAKRLTKAARLALRSDASLPDLEG